MKIVVNHNELKNVVNNFKDERNTLMSYIDELIKDINELKTYWQGDSSDVFCNKANNYLNYLKNVPYTYDTFINLLSRIDESYIQTDEFYSDKMKKGVIKHE